MPILEQCNVKDYERVSDLFFEIFSPLRIYTLDVERFYLIWHMMWGAYLDKKTLKVIDSPVFEEAFACSRMEAIMNKIFDLILQFNSLPRKKIIHKKELDCINTQVENFSKVSKEMSSYINVLETLDVYKPETMTTCLIDVGVRIGDYRCELETIRDAVEVVAEEYRLKDKNLKRWPKKFRYKLETNLSN